MSAEKANKKNIGIILLAAGESSRLGTPKQLLLYADRTLLQHSLQVANSSIANQIIVVLGAYADSIKRGIDHNVADVVINKEWQEGIASSIRLGISTLIQKSPSVEGAVVMVCDQPCITPNVLNHLITAHYTTGKPIITCSYADTYGPPTLFHKNMFPHLLNLKGDVGARSIIRQHANEVEVILFPEGNLDIDTEADYKNITKRESEL